MKPVRRVAQAALLAAGLGAVSLPAAHAQTVESAVDALPEADASTVNGIPPQDLQQLMLDRQQLVQALQQLIQDQTAGDQNSVLIDAQSVATARLALITEQLTVDRAREAQSPPNMLADLKIRDQYLTAQQLAVSAQLRIAVDRQTNNGGLLQADEMALQRARTQVIQARQQWATVRTRLVAMRSARQAPTTNAAPLAVPSPVQMQPAPPTQLGPPLPPAPTTH